MRGSSPCAAPRDDVWSGRLSNLLEERALQRDDTGQTARLERLRAAIAEWSVAIDALPPDRADP